MCLRLCLGAPSSNVEHYGLAFVGVFIGPGAQVALGAAQALGCAAAEDGDWLGPC
jgi:hypothetical protein